MSPQEAARLLGVAPTADAQQIRRAYRRQARQHHPDAGGDPALFHQLTTAADVLLNGGVTADAPSTDEQRAATPTGTTDSPTARGGGAASPPPPPSFHGPQDELLAQRFAFGTIQPALAPKRGGLSRFLPARSTHTQQAADFCAAAIARRVSKVLPAARLFHGVKLSRGPAVAQLLVAGQRAVIFAPAPVPDQRYVFSNQQLAPAAGTTTLVKQLTQQRRVLEQDFPQLNVVAVLACVTAAEDSRRPEVLRQDEPGAHPLITAANLANAIADACLFLGSGQHPHTIFTQLCRDLLHRMDSCE